MSFDHFNGLTVKLEWERKLFELSEAFVEANETLYILGTIVTHVLLEQL